LASSFCIILAIDWPALRPVVISSCVEFRDYCVAVRPSNASVALTLVLTESVTFNLDIQELTRLP
jgi:hypothetical protein